MNKDTMINIVGTILILIGSYLIFIDGCYSTMYITYTGVGSVMVFVSGLLLGFVMKPYKVKNK